MRQVKRAIISVSDKKGIVELGRELERRGVAIVSTGGTARALEEGGITVIPIRQITGNEKDAYFSGRMKTISFNFESALLFDRLDEEHARQAAELGIEPIDLVVCNLYPFEQTMAREGCTLADAVENIDIGGPCMVRAGAKNWKSVAVLTSPDQYAPLLDEMDRNDGALSDSFRLRCAERAFALTARYDTAITGYLEGQSGS
jgi:phosphoribosylaminoimidazolecarboxamide formyltransferase/IMP cyclohydrolase